MECTRAGNDYDNYFYFQMFTITILFTFTSTIRPRLPLLHWQQQGAGQSSDNSFVMRQSDKQMSNCHWLSGDLIKKVESIIDDKQKLALNSPSPAHWRRQWSG